MITAPSGHLHVLNYSGGACSAWAGRRLIDRYGAENVVAVFADVLMEDEDLYRFNRDVAQWWGIPIMVISKGLTPWELFRKHRMIGNSRTPLCSVELKRELLDRWHQDNCDPATTTIHVGMDWTEEHRMVALRTAKPGWNIDAPMLWEPLWDKCRILQEIQRAGLRIPRLYAMGFPHNNCGGFCVKAGQAQFAHLLKMMPERYAYHEQEEQKLRAVVGDYSVLQCRRGLKPGEKRRPLSLTDFRKRVEAGDFDPHDWGGCGCSLIDTPPTAQTA